MIAQPDTLALAIGIGMLAFCLLAPFSSDRTTL